MQRAQPYVEGAVQKAQPLVNRAQPLANRAIPIVQALPGQIAAVPGQVVETIRVTPGKVFNATVNAAASTERTVAALAGQVYQRAVNTVSSTAQSVKALPCHMRGGVAYTTDSIISAPGRAYQIVVDRSTPIIQSMAQLAQPYVHKSVGIVTPYVESTLTNPRAQSLYKSRIVQGGIEKATPLVGPALTHPRVKAVTEAVTEWACPRALTQ